MDPKNLLQDQLIVTRKELKNIRQEMLKLRKIHEKDIMLIKSHLFSNLDLNLLKTNELRSIGSESSKLSSSFKTQDLFSMKPIGYIESCFKTKNGTPRQASICPESKACLRINKNTFLKPDRALDGLNEFSHIWVLFLFHDNNSIKNPKAKIHPPRLNGSSVGIFATRSPHRPNPIGLSLIRLIEVKGNTLVLSGVDLIDGTPVLDIKPYIPIYDSPFPVKPNGDSKGKKNCDNIEMLPTSESKVNLPQSDLPINTSFHEEISDLKLSNEKVDIFSSGNAEVSEHGYGSDKSVSEIPCVKTAAWLTEQQKIQLEVNFTNRALNELSKFHDRNEHETECDFCLNFMSKTDAKLSIINILQNDPRSVYRRTKCQDKLYYFSIDSMHLTCWFDDTLPLVEVLRIQPLKYAIITSKLGERNCQL